MTLAGTAIVAAIAVGMAVIAMMTAMMIVTKIAMMIVTNIATKAGAMDIAIAIIMTSRFTGIRASGAAMMAALIAATKMAQRAF